MKKQLARRNFTKIAVVATLFTAIHAFPAEPSLSRRALTITDAIAGISAFGRRIEGSASEAAAFRYIESRLREAGISVSTSGFFDAKEGYSTSRIVEARIPGRLEDELAIVVPVSSWTESPDGTEGAYGIALALHQAILAAGRAAEASSSGSAGATLPISLRFVFLGAEKRGRTASGEEASLGSMTWIAHHKGQGRLAIVYLSVSTPPSRIALRSAGKATLSPYWFYEGVRRALESSGMDYGLEANRLQAYRLGIASGYGPSAPYLEAGIPAVELRGDAPIDLRNEPAKSPSSIDSGSGDWFSIFTERFSSSMAGGFPETWDRHYFIIQIGRLGVVIRELYYVVFLVALVALVLGSIIASTITKRSEMRRTFKHIPAVSAELAILFLALSAVFLAGKGIASLDARILGSVDAWKLSPRLFAGARIMFSFFLFLAVLTFLVGRRRLTSNPYFYEFASLLCLGADVLIFSALDISASFYFMWALIFVRLSLAVRRRWMTLAVYVLMGFPILIIATELAMRPDLVAYGRLIAPEYIGILALSGLTLPFFVYTASPLLFIEKRGRIARMRTAIALAAIAVAVEASALAIASASEPSTGPMRHDLRISESINQDEGSFEVELAGMRSLGKGSITRGQQTLEYDAAGDRAYLTGMDSGQRVAIRSNASPFLDRVDEIIDIAFSSPPYSVDIGLASEGPMLLYDSSLPYKLAVDGKSAVIYSGINPGNTLSLSLTVPASFSATLTVTARYLQSLEPFSQSSGSPLVEMGSSIRASRVIGAR